MLTYYVYAPLSRRFFAQPCLISVRSRTVQNHAE